MSFLANLLKKGNPNASSGSLSTSRNQSTIVSTPKSARGQNKSIGSFFQPKKRELTVMEKVVLAWNKFRESLGKILLDPWKHQHNADTCINEFLKPHLQVILDAVLEEDHRNRESKTIGECLEFILKEGILMEICAYG